MSVKKILVIFKTHLDVGFTDFSANVVQRYLNEFIPESVRLARTLRKSGSQARMIWTTGSWLIQEYLRTNPGPQGDEVRQGIIQGDISWHGLPFTTHTELMSGELFRYGLSISQKLDQQFGKKTIAAKMTDVPGHTRAMIPYLREAGIEFLHFGVNTASTPPNVPPLFRWKADNGDMVTVMYHYGYGNFSKIGNTGIAVNICFTGDNQGVHSPEKIEEIFADLQRQYPEAEVVAADLNDLALAVRQVEDELPVITDEIGDSWIHGVGTDPGKVCQFCGLQRFYKQLPEGADKEILARGLLMIPEHTWGMNVHVNLGDHENYDRDRFQEARTVLPNFRRMEASWAEQRAYLTDAVAQLSPENRKKAEAILAETTRPNLMKRYHSDITPGTDISYRDCIFRFNECGEITYLEKNGRVLADSKHRLLSLVYEQFGPGDYRRFYTQYNRNDEVWAREDFTKPGMEGGSDSHRRFEPEKAWVYYQDREDFLLVRYAFSGDAHKKCGCPLLFDLKITTDEHAVYFDLAWYGKPANRVAEAIWVGFRPIATEKRISKMGQLIDPQYVVEDGQCRLHGTDRGVFYRELSLETLDAPLVAPQEPSLLNFVNTKPLDADPVYFNLYNNVWGTNFPMWYDEDARFRFILRMNQEG